MLDFREDGRDHATAEHRLYHPHVKQPVLPSLELHDSHFCQSSRISRRQRRTRQMPLCLITAARLCSSFSQLCRYVLFSTKGSSPALTLAGIEASTSGVSCVDGCIRYMGD